MTEGLLHIHNIVLGHHDPKVTMRYAHLSPQAMLEAVNVVGNVVGRRPG